MHIQTPAKINWFLCVTGKRNDGFHEIVSAIQKISLYDSLDIEQSSEIYINGDVEFEDNIMLSSIEVVKGEYRIFDRGVRIDYKKNIPVAAGLGGGSSDAAAVLTALNTIWNLDLSRNELGTLAQSVGSDVSFFLDGNFSLVRGKGEIITPHTISEPYDLLMVNPGVPVSSGWAYRNNNEYTKISNPMDLGKRMIDALQNRDCDTIAKTMSNSLEKPVLEKYPVIAEIKQQLCFCGAFASLMSGSGSTVFGVFKDRESALAAEKHFDQYWTAVVKTLV